MSPLKAASAIHEFAVFILKSNIFKVIYNAKQLLCY